MKHKKIIFLFFIIVILLFNFVGASTNFEIKAPEGALQIEDSGHNKLYELKDEESISVTYKTNNVERTFEYPSLKKYKERIYFLFDKDGRIIEAKFKTSREEKYFLGNQEIFIPKDSEVDFSGKEIKIKMPSNGVLKAPEIITDEKNPYAEISYTSKDDKFLFYNGKAFRFLDKNNVLKFDGNFYFEKGNVEMKGMQIINPGIKTYIDFDGKIKDYRGAYISANEEKGILVTGSNINKAGPAINLLGGNSYGLKSQKGDHFAIQALGNSEGSYIKIINREKEKVSRIPKIETLNDFAINIDGKGVYYISQKEKLYLRPETLIKGFEEGKGSVPLEINSYKNKNGKIEKISTKSGNVLGVGYNVEMAWGKNPEFIQTGNSYSNYPSLKKGFSNHWLYYNLKNVNDINRFLGGNLQVYDYTGELNKVENVRWFTDLLAGLPHQVYRSINTIQIKNNIPYDNGHVVGLTNSEGLVQITSSNFNPRTLRHEITHSYQFKNPGNFWDEWKSVGYYINNNGELAPSVGYATSYGASNLYEDGAEFGNYIYEPNYWSSLISSNHHHSKIYRGKLSVLRKYNFITQQEYDSIFKIGRLDSSNPEKYIGEAKDFVSGKR